MRHLLQWSAAAVLVLVASTTVARAQTDDPVAALAKLVEGQGAIKDDDAKKKYTDELTAAINKLTTLTQFSNALLGIDWRDTRREVERLDKEILEATGAEKKAEKRQEQLGFKRLGDAQKVAYDTLTDKYRKTIETDLAKANLDQQRVISLAVLDLSQARAPSQKIVSSFTTRRARAAAGNMIPNLGVLTKSTDPIVNESVASILARAQTEWGEKPIADAFEQLLIHNPLAATRVYTAKAIGQAIDEMSPLKAGPQKDTLQTPDEMLKANADILPLLGKALNDADALVRVHAMFDIQSISDISANSNDEVAKSKQFGDTTAVLLKQVSEGPVEKALKDERPLVRTLAGMVIEDLAKIRSNAKGADATLNKGLEKLIPALAAATTDSNIRVRITSVEALGMLGELAQPAGKAIATAVADSDRFVRWSASRSLRLIKGHPPEGALANLSKLLADPDPALQQDAALTLASYKAEAASTVAALGENSTRGDPASRVEMLKALAAIGPKGAAAIPQIVKSLALTDPLPSNGYPPPFVTPELPASSTKVRQQAVITLSTFGAEAKAGLNTALADPDAEVRRLAGEALLKIPGN